jgi:hypothetical protein
MSRNSIGLQSRKLIGDLCRAELMTEMKPCPDRRQHSRASSKTPDASPKKTGVVAVIRRLVTRAENWVPPWRSPHEHTKRDGALQLARLNLVVATSRTEHPESKNPSGMVKELRSNLEERLHGTHNELFDWCSCCADRASSGAQAGLNHAKGKIRADPLELRLTRATHYAGWSNKNRWEELRR